MGPVWLRCSCLRQPLAFHVWLLNAVCQLQCLHSVQSVSKTKLHNFSALRHQWSAKLGLLCFQIPLLPLPLLPIYCSLLGLRQMRTRLSLLLLASTATGSSPVPTSSNRGHHTRWLILPSCA